jgi:insecticidal toxin complex protein TccC
MPTESLDHAHRDTPTLQVADPRGLTVRVVQYHRRVAVDPVEARVTHQQFDSTGRPMASLDPYLFALAQTDESAPANLTQVMSLSGVPLSTDSVDAGWRVALQGGAGQVVERWDGRGSHSLVEYDELLRPVAMREKGQSVEEHVLERFTYAGVGEDVAAHNLCGQLVRHDDPAGTLLLVDLGLGGTLLRQTRRFLRDTNPPDWPGNVAERDALLEPGDGASTSQHYAPSGELLDQTDAFGNRQSFAYTIAGELKDTRLTLAGDSQVEKILGSDIQYNISGQIEAETAGNGVITRHRYDPANGRLINLSAHKANGTALQNLNYSYDAVGNVMSLEDAAQPIRYFNNQRIEPIKTYLYDTLYQLIHATGWEAKTGQGGPALPDRQPLPLDPNQIANYTQTYHYDAGGNLLDLVHIGAQPQGRILTRARYSNRCLPEREGRPPTEEELADGFDANGNLCELQAGQSLGWDLRNQLSAVRPVIREEGNDDSETYIYDGSGQRVRKVRSSQTNARTLISEVRYLPGLEIRTHGGTGEILHVITVSAGSNSVQVLHWAAKPPDEIDNDQVRYTLNDHLKSNTLELDQQADLISEEWYYPFGGTACWAARSVIEAAYKTVRYSGKERDATGLYYYGFRYYAPWLQRWINPDPAGYVDGMNLFAMVQNNPVVYFDGQGNDRKNYNHLYLWEFVLALKKYELPSDAFIKKDKAIHYIKKIEKMEDLKTENERKIFERQVTKLLLKLLPSKPLNSPGSKEQLDNFHALLKAAIKFEDLPRKTQARSPSLREANISRLLQNTPSAQNPAVSDNPRHHFGDLNTETRSAVPNFYTSTDLHTTRGINSPSSDEYQILPLPNAVNSGHADAAVVNPRETDGNLIQRGGSTHATRQPATSGFPFRATGFGTISTRVNPNSAANRSDQRS